MDRIQRGVEGHKKGKEVGREVKRGVETHGEGMERLEGNRECPNS